MKLGAFLVPISLAAVTIDLRLCTDTSTAHGSLPNATGKQGALSVTLDSAGSEGLFELEKLDISLLQYIIYFSIQDY